MEKGNEALLRRKIDINKRALSEVLFYVLAVAALLFLYLATHSDGLRVVTYIIVMLYAVGHFSRWLFDDD